MMKLQYFEEKFEIIFSNIKKNDARTAIHLQKFLRWIFQDPNLDSEEFFHRKVELKANILDKFNQDGIYNEKYIYNDEFLWLIDGSIPFLRGGR